MVLIGTSAIIALSIATILLLILLVVNIKVKRKKQVNWCCIWLIACLLICCVGQLSSLLFAKSWNIPLIYFDYFVYIGTCFMPLAFFFFGLTFAKTKIKFKKSYILLFIIPILSLIILWTNDLHHLFYVTYDIINANTVFGPYFPIHSIYTYLLIIVGIGYLLRYSIKNSGFFSQQSFLLIIGSLIPLVVNIIGAFGVEMSIFVTPICFTATALFFSFAIIKFDFLNVSPIALQSVVDRMSDGYVVLDENNIIIDFNKTFLHTANITSNRLRGKDMFALVKKDTYFNIDYKLLKEYIYKAAKTGHTYSFEIKLSGVEKYFIVEVSSIVANESILGTLLLFKDITQHNIDMKTIKSNQDMLMERERLASLGQLIGGIAHNLKTPIMSISGAAEGLSDLVKEYDASIGDPEVTNNDHHEIAKDMSVWISKIKDYSAYMSDIITTVKGQAVALTNEDSISFNIGELLKRVDILMKHELKNALIYLNTTVNVDQNLTLPGDVNSLVQVINNMISNSIQAYKGKKEENIDLIVDKENSNLVISICDYGAGIPKKVQDKLFKEMVTTKGKNGTGLGLYMSYSTIRGHFNGDITLDSKPGKTIFRIIIPLKNN